MPAMFVEAISGLTVGALNKSSTWRFGKLSDRVDNERRGWTEFHSLIGTSVVDGARFIRAGPIVGDFC